jgi:hypothetical protein
MCMHTHSCLWTCICTILYYQIVTGLSWNLDFMLACRQSLYWYFECTAINKRIISKVASIHLLYGISLSAIARIDPEGLQCVLVHSTHVAQQHKSFCLSVSLSLLPPPLGLFGRKVQHLDVDCSEITSEVWLNFIRWINHIHNTCSSPYLLWVCQPVSVCALPKHKAKCPFSMERTSFDTIPSACPASESEIMKLIDWWISAEIECLHVPMNCCEFCWLFKNTCLQSLSVAKCR